ncbi:hypothetical protein [Dactylosporangium matsuzakiense]|uniref:Uncharacterized protein n=1 Tax=Dactylosporangium matsuzakiense TaxID=53360 RepID=A0A9W6KE44_9ACTN|nr:hypothetical protein [Dactylosporangium matsuzakiense]UWZ45596.1 hypothetical protein Dmats_03490 [Dactylosporangium matsuzakiense]GLL00392.1 hypothetical protein GCM10017581_021320 [Dactylosporangium matsuzakiense]
MSGDSLVIVPAQRRARPSELDRTEPLRYVGRVATDPVAALADKMRDDCLDAVDIDEIAAILEANGINDRVADREYGSPSVFALAGRVVARSLDSADTQVFRPIRVEGPGLGRVVADTLMRALIYLTPLAIGVGAASEVDGVPALATTGTLILGWGGGQALSYLGYRALSERGRTAAARLLGTGFAALAVLWALVLLGEGARAYVVAAVQLALFAVAGVTLVTNRERVVIAAVVPVWVATAGLRYGLGIIVLLACVTVLLAVAYRPVLGRRPALVRRRWRSWRHDVGYAALYGLVGTGQAALLRTVALDGIAPHRVPVEAIPLLVGVPLMELTLVWHQRRIASARAFLADRFAFDRTLGRISAGTVAVLAVPLATGAAIAGSIWFGLIPRGQSLAAAVLLMAVYALCLVLAAHGRAGTAAIVVWWPTLLITGVTHWAPALVHVSPTFAETLAVATLLGAGLPGLAVAALVLRDPESYRE